MLALGRLSWSGYNYVRAIDAINQIGVTVDAAATPRPDHVTLQVEIKNNSALPLTVQSLSLDLYGSGTDSIGATYDPFDAVHVAAHSSAHVTRDLTIVEPDQTATRASTGWRLRGDVVFRLPLTGHYFSRAISVPLRVGT